MTYERLIQKELNDWYLSRLKSCSYTGRLAALSNILASAVAGEYEPPLTEQTLDSLAAAEERRLATLAGVQISDEGQETTQRLIQWAAPRFLQEETIRRLRAVGEGIQDALDSLIDKVRVASSEKEERKLYKQQNRLYRLQERIDGTIEKLEDELFGR